MCSRPSGPRSPARPFVVMARDHLQFASPALREAVTAMGGDAFVAAIHELVEINEEYAVHWFDARSDDTTADEVLDWELMGLSRTAPGLAHAEIWLELRTFPVDEDEEFFPEVVTVLEAFVRVLLEPEIRADRFELGFAGLGAWILHDAIRFADDEEERAPDRP